MLILTRRLHEKIVIGEDIFISVLGVKGNQVRLGIECAKDIPVHRQEIFNRIQALKEEALQGDNEIHFPHAVNE